MLAKTTDLEIAPVELQFDLACTPERAFKAYTDQIDKWWPLDTHSVDGPKAQTCCFETEVGGHIYEILENGDKSIWGTVLACSPPNAIRYSWHPGRSPDVATEVEVTFTSVGDKTHMTLVHRGWESYGESGQAFRNQYVGGWKSVIGDYFRRFVE